MSYAGDAGLAAVLTTLRDEGLPFLDTEYGWPPGAIFDDLRGRGLVEGPYDGIVWGQEGDPRVRPNR